MCMDAPNCFASAACHWLQASKDVLAMAALEVDLSKVDMGQTVTVKWRGKPVFVRRRTEAEIDGARAVDIHQLRDPERDEDRAKNPEVRLLATDVSAGMLLLLIMPHY